MITPGSRNRHREAMLHTRRQSKEKRWQWCIQAEAKKNGKIQWQIDKTMRDKRKQWVQHTVLCCEFLALH
jgi:hypothetical protein